MDNIIKKKAQALELLNNYVISCAFIHDDWNSSLQHSDWDHYDTNPFLLGAHTCVINSLDGFGESYLEYLHNLNSLPRNIFVPNNTNTILAKKLLSDDSILQKFLLLIQQEKLDISCFYSDEIREHDELLTLIHQNEHKAQLFPSQEIFQIANDKVKVRQILEAHHIPIPQGLICDSLSNLEQYIKMQFTQYHSRYTLVKQSHRDNTLLDANTSKLNLNSFTFPLVVERVYPIINSPICHIISFGNRVEVLFVLDQIIDNYHHIGNIYPPANLSIELINKIENYSCEIATLFGNFVGVMGIDYIVTIDNELYVVDVNPRFCSSTYPQFFLERMKFIKNDSIAKSRIIYQKVRTLQEIASYLASYMFKPDKGGILLYNPVYDFENGNVSHFSSLFAGHNVAQIIELEKQFNLAIRRLKNSGCTF